MIHRTIPLTLLLVGSIVLVACHPTTETPVPPTPAAPPATPTPAAASNPPTPPPKSHTQPGPTTVLLLGTDRRSPDYHAENTDTLMIFHLDPNTRRIVIFSIPRDLYVEIPGHSEARINTAYARGEEDGTGGLALAGQTVSTTLGIPIQHVALFDFRVFVALIDTISGIDVDVPYDIVDPTYPDQGIGYDPFYLPAGQHHLDGEMALKYARTRATLGSDFDRNTRQRQIVLSVRDRVKSLDMLPALIAQSPQLWSSLHSAFETDLTLGEIVDLAVIGSRIPADQIVTAGIDQTCTYSWTTPGGADVLIIDRDAAWQLISDVFAPPATAAVAQ